ncbi:hypothetical protein GOP47_0005773 [Adiantum capillus-veneris]|uniref:Uncharacterized protein n=1 Tax=Adiantum capillus-veneris TaxID=13818 RepID=A0A9D4V5S6_ADICA|nr:hypothetical protein GOP47_0005773 [Adiantum capillus-veneris]
MWVKVHINTHLTYWVKVDRYVQRLLHKFLPCLIVCLWENADDNVYAEGVVPELEFVLVEADIAGAGVDWTLLVLNNEVGFSRANVESLCSIGRSTKKGRRESGYIGEKGIGFKSVFLVTHTQIIISKGYCIRFNDAPTQDTELGYIVPEWADSPTDGELCELFETNESELPNTIIVLPIRQDKVQAMCEQLFELSPRLVLFLNKIDKLSARQIDRSSLIVSKSMVVQRDVTAPSQECAGMVPNNCNYSMVHLSCSKGEAAYHVWKQEFPVEANHEVDHRRDVQTWNMTLAFPLEDYDLDATEPDIYAFLPTKIVAGFPFIINADFFLVSSRDTLRFDSQWNKCILACIPQAFVTAFMFFLRSAEIELPEIGLRDVYRYIPSDKLYVEEFEFVRAIILRQIMAHNAILCDSAVGQHFPLSPGVATDNGVTSAGPGQSSCTFFFCQPALVRTIDPNFRCLLKEAHNAKIQPPKLLTLQRVYIVDEDVQEDYEEVLKTLEVLPFTPDLYILCLGSPNWLMSLPDTLYVELLRSLSKDLIDSDRLKPLPLVKYLDHQNKVTLLAPSDSEAISVYISQKHKDVVILSHWTPIFQRWLSVHFMPNSTVRAAMGASNDTFSLVCRWLKKVANIQQLSVKTYAEKLASICKEMHEKTHDEPSLALGLMHFLLHAIQDGYLLKEDCDSIFSEMPVLDRSGDVYYNFKGPIFLPPSVSKWPKYLLNNTWEEDIVFLSESYLELPAIMADEIGPDCVTQFLRQAVNAKDLFDLTTPLVSSPYLPRGD